GEGPGPRGARPPVQRRHADPTPWRPRQLGTHPERTPHTRQDAVRLRAEVLLLGLPTQHFSEPTQRLDQLQRPVDQVLGAQAVVVRIGADPAHGAHAECDLQHDRAHPQGTGGDDSGQLGEGLGLASPEGVHGATVGGAPAPPSGVTAGCGRTRDVEEPTARPFPDEDVPDATGPGVRGRRAPRAGGAHTTMLTIFGARMISLRTVRPSSSSCTRGSAITAASRSSSEISGSTSMRWRTLPLTWMTQVTCSAFSSSGSAAG